MKRLTTPARRIVLAIGISIAAHAMALWGPEIELPSYQPQLPPLTAKLEPLPKIEAKPLAEKPKQRPAPQPEAVVHSEPQPLPVAEQSDPVPQETPPEPERLAAAPPPPEIQPQPEERPKRPPLPKRAQLKFDVSQGDENFKIGETIHTLEVSEGHYLLKADIHTTGLVNLFKSYRMLQTSKGAATEYELLPETFSEEIIESKGRQLTRAEFDRSNKKIRYSNGSEAVLPPQTQDILSILYQFPALEVDTEIVTISISNGKKLEKYNFEIGLREALDTPMGKLQTVHFRKMHPSGAEGLEIWFAQEYRYLPVKMMHIDRDGSIAGVAVITEIRLSDE